MKPKALILALIIGATSWPALGAVVYEDVMFVEGRDYFSKPIEIETPGTYEAVLTDLEFPAPLETLGMAVSSATQTLGTLYDAGSLDFLAETAGTYYLSVFAETASWGDFGSLGLIGIKVSHLSGIPLSAVPLPGAFWLFSSALGVLAGAARRRHH